MVKRVVKTRTQISTIGKSNNLSPLKTPHCHELSGNGCSSEAGFTLMELIIVIVLIAIVLTISIPTLRNSLYTNELNSTTRKIIGTVKELRNLAIREQQPYELHFDLDSNSIWYKADDGKDIVEDEDKRILEFPSDIILKEVQTHSQGMKSLGTMILWISKRGYMDQTVVHLSDGDDKEITLFFSPFSGSAKVYEDYVDIE
jgi:prepilin-type N-terminal cleavage/methylation domain-containing protein